MTIIMYHCANVYDKRIESHKKQSTKGRVSAHDGPTEPNLAGQ